MYFVIKNNTSNWQENLVTTEAHNANIIHNNANKVNDLTFMNLIAASYEKTLFKIKKTCYCNL